MKMTRERLLQIDQMSKSHDNTYHILIQDINNEMIPLCGKIEAMNAACIIEIGVAYGATLRVWYEIIQSGGKVIGIDTSPLEPGPDIVYGVRWNINDVSDGKKVHYVRGHSENPETIKAVTEIVGLGKADVLFIDAGHSYEEVRNDYQNYFPFLRVGGMLVLCDANYDNGPAGPYKLWNEMKDTLDSPEVIQGGCGTAIGYKRAIN